MTTSEKVVDNFVRFGGAVAVIVTVEAICGYYLWLGSTVHVHLPDQLGWAPQFGLVGGAAVGTRAWHRGRGKAAGWGMSASLVGLGFTIVDAGFSALLHDEIVSVRAGWLALVLIVECVIIGWLAIHTLFANGRALATSQPQVASKVTVPASAVRLPDIEPATDTGPAHVAAATETLVEADDPLVTVLRALPTAVAGPNAGVLPSRHAARKALSKGWDDTDRALEALRVERAAMSTA